MRAWGGHANDNDTFKTAIKYLDKQDLVDKLGALGVTLNSIPSDYPKPIVDKSYSASEYELFKKPIELFENLEQPGYSIINGQKVYIWVFDYYFTISISNLNMYEVSEEDFEVCLEIEKTFDNLGWQEIRDTHIEKSVCCISKAVYPELYE